MKPVNSSCRLPPSADPGETLVLDMGEPIKINDLANRVIALSGRSDARIVYTGLRPGEKLTEALLSPGEEDVRPTHPLITQVPITPIDLDALRRLVEASRDAGVYTQRTRASKKNSLASSTRPVRRGDPGDHCLR